MKNKASLKGDKLRELMLFVYLNNKYGRSTKYNISELKQFIGYSAGGIYNALDSSGFFVRNGSDITLSKKGKDYVKKELMHSFENFYPVSYFLVFLGVILLVHWYLYTYHGEYLVFEWNIGLAIVMSGLVLRFALPSLTYIGLIIKKKFFS